MTVDDLARLVLAAGLALWPMAAIAGGPEEDCEVGHFCVQPRVGSALPEFCVQPCVSPHFGSALPADDLSLMLAVAIWLGWSCRDSAVSLDECLSKWRAARDK